MGLVKLLDPILIFVFITQQDKKIRTVSRSILGIIVVAIIGFAGLKTYPLVHGPVIQVATLDDGTTLSEPLITISGIARYTQNLNINGAPVATAPDGSFGEKVLLSPGYNIITMQASDRFGKIETKNYTLVLHENSGGTFTLQVPPFSSGI